MSDITSEVILSSIQFLNDIACIVLCAKGWTIFRLLGNNNNKEKKQKIVISQKKQQQQKKKQKIVISQKKDSEWCRIFLLFLPWLPSHFYLVVIEQQQSLGSMGEQLGAPLLNPSVR